MTYFDGMGCKDGISVMYCLGIEGSSVRVVATGRFVGIAGSSVNVVAAIKDGISVIGISNVGIMYRLGIAETERFGASV